MLHLDDENEIMPVEKEIRDLASNLQLVKDEQSYLVVRERVHRNTCESTVSAAERSCIANPPNVAARSVADIRTRV